jgi:hypothetical protein
MAVRAIDGKSARPERKPTTEASGKYDYRTFLLRMGFIGDEFKTARQHLLARLRGDSAFKNGRRAA